jgi:hypothetical protein
MYRADSFDSTQSSLLVPGASPPDHAQPCGSIGGEAVSGESGRSNRSPISRRERRSTWIYCRFGVRLRVALRRPFERL